MDARAEGAEEASAWSSAVRHLEVCRRCREVAYELDPLLVFHRLPVVAEGEGPAMQVRVASLLAARAVEGRWPASTARVARRFAVAAAMGLGALVFGGSPLPSPSPERPVSAPVRSVDVAARAAEPDLEPLFELASASDVAIVEWPSEEVSVVMIFDRRFDV